MKKIAALLFFTYFAFIGVAQAEGVATNEFFVSPDKTTLVELAYCEDFKEGIVWEEWLDLKTKIINAGYKKIDGEIYNWKDAELYVYQELAFTEIKVKKVRFKEGVIFARETLGLVRTMLVESEYATKELRYKKIIKFSMPELNVIDAEFYEADRGFYNFKKAISLEEAIITFFRIKFRITEVNRTPGDKGGR